MDENTNPARQYGPPPPAHKLAPAPDLRDRWLLLPALIAGFLFQELLRSLLHPGGPALGAVLTAALLAVLLLWYTREKKPLAKRHLLLFFPACLVTLSLGLFAQGPLSALNCLAAPALLLFWALCACGVVRGARWTMLVKAFLMCFAIPWKHVDKPVRAAGALFRSKSYIWLWVLVGLGIGLPLIFLLILPLLRGADGVFSQLTDSLIHRLLLGGWANYLGRFFWAVCLAFLVYSALYALRHDGPWRPEEKPFSPKVPGAVSTTVLALVDAIYLFFVVIQFAYLFGGPGQLVRSGISYAEYARSGFFQLVFIALLNLSLSMLAAALTRREGKAWAAVRILSILLLAMTAVILASAAFRMHMYVSAYGLSILRALTLWGMVMIALWLAFAVWKLLRPAARLFRLFLASALLGWTVLSLCNLNGLVARFNARQYLSGDVETLDSHYLYSLGPAALPALRDLAEDANARGDKSAAWHLELDIQDLEESARTACADWRSWNLQCALEGRKHP